MASSSLEELQEVLQKVEIPLLWLSVFTLIKSCLASKGRQKGGKGGE